MSTPTDGPGGQPNPYGQPQGQPANPYGTPPHQPVGGGYGTPPNQPVGGGYGSSYPGGQQGGQSENKGMAIAALVLAFIACVLPNIISLVLAIIVLVKKKGGKGLAIAAIVIDILVLIAWAALAAGGVWLFGNVVTIDNAEKGQCVNTTTEGDTVSMLKQDCSKKHDAEVIVVGELTADELATYETDGAAMCQTRFTDDGGDPADVEGDAWELLTEDIPPKEGDTFVCLIEMADGSKLPAK